MTAQQPGPDPVRADHGVVVGVDESRHAEGAVRWAARLASARDWPLRIVHALDVGAIDPVLGVRYPDVSEALERLELRGEDALARALRTAHAVDPGLSVETEMSSASAARSLVRNSESANIVVLAASGLGEAGATSIGSTTAAVTSHAHCPVVVVRVSIDRDRASSAPVVLGMDRSIESEGAVASAFDEASRRGAGLVVVHAWSDLRLGALASRHELLSPPPEFERQESALITELLAPWLDKYPAVSVNVRVYLDGPREHLLRWSQHAQLIVIGSRGRGGLPGLLIGSTSTALLQQARCPVMVVRQRTFPTARIGGPS